MHVNGIEFDEARMSEVFDERLPASFAFSDVTLAFSRAGFSREGVDRAADRFLQKMRKAGRVSFGKGRWTKRCWTKTEAA